MSTHHHIRKMLIALALGVFLSTIGASSVTAQAADCDPQTEVCLVPSDPYLPATLAEFTTPGYVDKAAVSQILQSAVSRTGFDGDRFSWIASSHQSA